MRYCLDSEIPSGHTSKTIREIIAVNPWAIYERYMNDPEFDLNLDIILALELRRFNMKRAYIKRLSLLALSY